MGNPKKGTAEYEAWILTPEYREYCKKFSRNNSGDKNPFFGKRHSKKTRKKMSKSRIGKEPWNKGKKGCFSEETRKQMSVSQSKRPSPSKKTRKKMSDKRKGIKLSKETRMRMSVGRKNYIRIHPMSDETRNRISESKKEKGDWSGEKNPNFGNHDPLPEEHRRKISEAILGENNPNYKDGKSREPYPITFNPVLKRKIRSDYGHKCFFPGCDVTTESNGRDLDVHHYDYDKNSKNCVPLCRKHNGVVNGNRKEWEAYFEMKVSVFWAC